jgi:hypothetical protein
MTLKYHGLPITPAAELLTLAGKNSCVSHATSARSQCALAHQIGSSVMLDNGAFSVWKSGAKTDWPAYYAWCDQWLDYPTTWAVIPDVIDAGTQEQDALLREWPHGHKGAPVWHMDEPIHRALRLLDEWPRICFGSTAEYAVIFSPSWTARMDQVWNEIAKAHKRTPTIHMLRGLDVVARAPYPFASADSSDVGRNHNRPQNTARAMADRWDAAQCPPRWTIREPHPDMFEGQAA